MALGGGWKSTQKLINGVCGGRGRGGRGGTGEAGGGTGEAGEGRMRQGRDW